MSEAISKPADFDLDKYIASGALGWFPKETIHLNAISLPKWRRIFTKRRYRKIRR